MLTTATFKEVKPATVSPHLGNATTVLSKPVQAAGRCLDDLVKAAGRDRPYPAKDRYHATAQEMVERQYGYNAVVDVYHVTYRYADRGMRIIRRIGDTLRKGTDGVPFAYATLEFFKVQRGGDGQILSDGDPERFTPRETSRTMSLNADEFKALAAEIEQRGFRFIDSKNAFMEPSSLPKPHSGAAQPRRDHFSRG